MKSQTEEYFSDFYEKWMAKLEGLLHLLLEVSMAPSQDPAAYVAAVGKLTSHHKEYYVSKWAAAHDDVFAFFSPGWLTPLERAHLWVTGWRPSTAFRLVGPGRISGLTEGQAEKISGLRAKIKVAEERVEWEMERQQPVMAGRKTVEVARLETRPGLVELMVVAGLEKAMKMADCVRLQTLKGVLDVLSPRQGVEFLTSKSTVQIHVRKLGREMMTK